MNFEFGEDPLGMVPRGVYADAELARNRLVRAALRQHYGHLLFPAGQAEPRGKPRLAVSVQQGAVTCGRYPGQFPSELPQPVDRAPHLAYQSAVVPSKINEGGEEVEQSICRPNPQLGQVRLLGGYIFLHGQPRGDEYQQQSLYHGPNN
jgi:hypothetical protein